MYVAGCVVTFSWWWLLLLLLWVVEAMPRLPRSSCPATCRVLDGCRCCCCFVPQELLALLSILASNAPLLAKPFLLRFVPELYDAVVCIVGALNEDSLRSLGKDFAPDLTTHLRAILRRVYSKEETGKRVEVRALSSPTLRFLIPCHFLLTAHRFVLAMPYRAVASPTPPRRCT